MNSKAIWGRVGPITCLREARERIENSNSLGMARERRSDKNELLWKRKKKGKHMGSRERRLRGERTAKLTGIEQKKFHEDE